MESQEGNRDAVRRFWEEVFNRGDYGVADEIFAPDHILHHPAFTAEEAQGPDAMKVLVGLFRRVSPNLEATVQDELAQGYKVVNLWTASGTLADRVRNPGTGGDRFVVSGISIFRTSDGQITETWKRFEPHPDEAAQRRMPPGDLREWLLEGLPVRQVPPGRSTITPDASLICIIAPWLCY